MPPDMAVDMRRSKLKAEEAALLAGELKKPSWQSRNEGIHERVSFEDTIWGFDLAGGSFYKTPLRVVAVKPDSRAEKAGIRIGDKLTRINDIDTSTLTIQEAHEIIIESGVHLRLAVSAPEDEEDSYFCYEDPVEDGYDSEEERRLQEELERKRQVHAKVSSYWSLQWPWVSKRRIIYRESNCFMVPSKYENNHRDKFSPQPMLKTQEDIVLESKKSEKDKEAINVKQSEQKDNSVVNNAESLLSENNKSKQTLVNGNGNEINYNSLNGNLGKIPEAEEDSIKDDSVNSQNDISIDKTQNDELHKDINDEISSRTDEANSQDDLLEEISSQPDHLDSKDDTVDEISLRTDEVVSPQDDAILDEVLNANHEDVLKDGEDKILDSILSDGEEQSLEKSESIDER